MKGGLRGGAVAGVEVLGLKETSSMHLGNIPSSAVSVDCNNSGIFLPAMVPRASVVMAGGDPTWPQGPSGGRGRSSSFPVGELSGASSAAGVCTSAAVSESVASPARVLSLTVCPSKCCDVAGHERESQLRANEGVVASVAGQPQGVRLSELSEDLSKLNDSGGLPSDGASTGLQLDLLVGSTDQTADGGERSCRRPGVGAASVADDARAVGTTCSQQDSAQLGSRNCPQTCHLRDARSKTTEEQTPLHNFSSSNGSRSTATASPASLGKEATLDGYSISQAEEFLACTSQKRAAAVPEDRLEVCVAVLLKNLATRGSEEASGTKGGDGVVTVFHSSEEPSISVEEYVARLYRFFRCSSACTLLALIYIDRLIRRHSGFALNVLNVHRLFVTALTVAVKFFDDTYYSNSYYAKVGGLSLKELNRLEATLLILLDFRLHVNPEEFLSARAFVLFAALEALPQRALRPARSASVASPVEAERTPQTTTVRGERHEEDAVVGQDAELRKLHRDAVPRQTAPAGEGRCGRIDGARGEAEERQLSASRTSDLQIVDRRAGRTTQANGAEVVQREESRTVVRSGAEGAEEILMEPVGLSVAPPAAAGEVPAERMVRGNVSTCVMDGEAGTEEDLRETEGLTRCGSHLVLSDHCVPQTGGSETCGRPTTRAVSDSEAACDDVYDRDMESPGGPERCEAGCSQKWTEADTVDEVFANSRRASLQLVSGMAADLTRKDYVNEAVLRDDVQRSVREDRRERAVKSSMLRGNSVSGQSCGQPQEAKAAESLSVRGNQDGVQGIPFVEGAFFGQGTCGSLCNSTCGEDVSSSRAMYAGGQSGKRYENLSVDCSLVSPRPSGREHWEKTRHERPCYLLQCDGRCTGWQSGGCRHTRSASFCCPAKCRASQTPGAERFCDAREGTAPHRAASAAFERGGVVETTPLVELRENRASSTVGPVVSAFLSCGRDNRAVSSACCSGCLRLSQHSEKIHGIHLCSRFECGGPSSGLQEKTPPMERPTYRGGRSGLDAGREDKGGGSLVGQYIRGAYEDPAGLVCAATPSNYRRELTWAPLEGDSGGQAKNDSSVASSELRVVAFSEICKAPLEAVSPLYKALRRFGSGRSYTSNTSTAATESDETPCLGRADSGGTVGSRVSLLTKESEDYENEEELSGEEEDGSASSHSVVPVEGSELERQERSQAPLASCVYRLRPRRARGGEDEVCSVKATPLRVAHTSNSALESGGCMHGSLGASVGGRTGNRLSGRVFLSGGRNKKLEPKGGSRRKGLLQHFQLGLFC